MQGRILIVEDEPIAALDLQQEVEEFGCEVVGLAKSADEALMAVEENRPDLALMDMRIVGSMDGIQTARMLRSTYQVPVIFLASHSDESTIARAAREMPYGVLTKPYEHRALKATLQLALHKARIDARQNAAHQAMATTVRTKREGVLTVTMDKKVRFMNAAAEVMTGWDLSDARGRRLEDVVKLSDGCRRPMRELDHREEATAIEEFGWSLEHTSGARVLTDFSVAPLTDQNDQRTGFVVTLRAAAERLRSQAMEAIPDELSCFDQAPMAMVQLDSDGHIVRVNQALLNESGVAAESLLGRSLAGLSMDPDPRIACDLMHMLLQSGTAVATRRSHATH
jgi:PAS domain S-box-containing protein